MANPQSHLIRTLTQFYYNMACLRPVTVGLLTQQNSHLHLCWQMLVLMFGLVITEALILDGAIKHLTPTKTTSFGISHLLSWEDMMSKVKLIM